MAAASRALTAVFSFESFVLSRADGVVLARYPIERRNVEDRAKWLQRPARTENVPLWSEQASESPRLIVSASPLATYPLVVTASVTQDAALDIWQRQAAWIIGGTMCALLCSALLLAFLRSQMLLLMRREAHWANLSRQDPLTQVANRNVFVEKLEEGIRLSRRNESMLAILYVDLDHFKQINDTEGHLAGDQVLKAAADRMRAATRAGDTVARIGGDEFAIIGILIDGVEGAEQLAQRIIRALNAPVEVGGRPLKLGASVGVALYPDHASTPAELMGLADDALYQAKRAGRGSYWLHSPQVDVVGPSQRHRKKELTSHIKLVQA